VVLFDPEALVAVNVTVFDPVVANAWVGLWEVLVPPSTKFHCQEMGVPADVSVNWTVCPGTGEAGLKLNEAASAVATVTVLVVLFDPEALFTVMVTVLDPAVVYEWLGFWAVLVPPSPKFHCQEVGVPADVSVNCIAWPAEGKVGE
jgi:hypothetical protein